MYAPFSIYSDMSKKIFISYSRDSEEQSRKILELAESLNIDGLECTMDQTIDMADMIQGWSRWMTRKVAEADYVLIVCTKRYAKLVTGEIKINQAEEGAFESIFSFNEIYNSLSLKQRAVILLLDKEDNVFIPAPLSENPQFLISEDIEKLRDGLISGEFKILEEEEEIISVPELLAPPAPGLPTSEHPQASPSEPAVPTESMASIFDAGSLDFLQEKSIIQATVTEVGDKEVMVDLSAKSEGYIPVEEFFDYEGLQIGETIEVYLEKMEDINAHPILSYDKARQIRTWEKMKSEWQEGSIIKGRVKEVARRGLIVNVGIDSFLPASQIDIRYTPDLDQFVGQTFDFKIVRIDLQSRHVTVSRRALLEEERRQKKEVFYKEVSEGDILSGVVRTILDYGAFLDLGGIDGFVPISETSWAKIAHPTEVIRLGEEIDVKVMDLDKERDRVGLSIKEAQESPWHNLEIRYPAGKPVRGRVTTLMSFGAFVELEPGLEGLVHISEFSWTRRINKPEEMVKSGDEVTAIVMDTDKENQRLSLSIRRLDPDPWESVERRFTIGMRLKGPVKNIVNFGVFVEIEEGIEGLVHISDMTWKNRPRHPSDVVKEGEEIEVVILEINAASKRISLGMKQVASDPWESIESYFKVGDIVNGKVIRILPFGAFVAISETVEGMVHISEICDQRIEKVEEVLNVGQEVKARLIRIEQEERRIALSIKAAEYDLSAYGDNDSALKSLANQSPQSEQETGLRGSGLNSLGDLLDQATKK